LCAAVPKEADYATRDGARKDAFDRCWQVAGSDGAAPTLQQRSAHAVLLVRGLFGAWIPGHFQAPLRRLRALGWDARIADTDPRGAVDANRRALARQLDRIVAAGKRPLVLAHSKGGLEVLLALAADPTLAAAIGGLVTVQTARSGAPYLECLFTNDHPPAPRAAARWHERIEAGVLTAVGARPACAELRAAVVREWATRIDAAMLPFPWLAVATHTEHSGRSLELKHARLTQLAPGAPHDGVFYTAEQRWPRARNLTLAGIDHAQPSVGGGGFEHDRFWVALLQLLLDPTDADADANEVSVPADAT